MSGCGAVSVGPKRGAQARAEGRSRKMEAASRQRGCHPTSAVSPVSGLDLVFDGAARGTEKWRLARLGRDDRAYRSETARRAALPAWLHAHNRAPPARKHRALSTAARGSEALRCETGPAPSLAQSALPNPGSSQTGYHRPIVSWHPWNLLLPALASAPTLVAWTHRHGRGALSAAEECVDGSTLSRPLVISAQRRRCVRRHQQVSDARSKAQPDHTR